MKPLYFLPIHRMSHTLLISYDLGGPETSDSYKKLIEKIKALGTWAKPLESFWFVKTSDSASSVRDSLKPAMDSNDKLLVLDVTGVNWSSLNVSSDVTTWMKGNL